ncbi:MAG TPA: nucleotidyltransferase domain-containing protein [Rhodothermales bacterium]|nr:nucleotidyltransferase domain-containing protein [Rhodothermales bacterium]
MDARLPPTMPPHVRAALAEAKAWLAAHYGERLERVVLYGSHARGDAGPDSDLDLLVVLRGGYEPYAEIKGTLPLYHELLDRYDVLVSIQPYSEGEAADLGNPFMWNVADEGVEV